jgi:hypothetical protein
VKQYSNSLLCSCELGNIYLVDPPKDRNRPYECSFCGESYSEEEIRDGQAKEPLDKRKESEL